MDLCHVCRCEPNYPGTDVLEVVCDAWGEVSGVSRPHHITSLSTSTAWSMSEVVDMIDDTYMYNVLPNSRLTVRMGSDTYVEKSQWSHVDFSCPTGRGDVDVATLMACLGVALTFFLVVGLVLIRIMKR